MSTTISRRLAVKLADELNRRHPKNELAYKKIVLGAEIIFLNISKLAILAACAFVLGVFVQTILVMIGFNILRRTAFGVHSKSSNVCSVASIGMFVLVPFLLNLISASPHGMFAPPYIIAPVYVLILAAMYLYAPADTAAQPLIGEKKRKRLKKRSIISCLVLTAVLLISPYYEINFMVMLGSIYSAVFILPITYTLLRRERDNYKKYEVKSPANPPSTTENENTDVT